MYTKKIYSKCFSQCICHSCNVIAFITSSAATTTSIVDWFDCFLELIKAWVIFIAGLYNQDSRFIHCLAASFISVRICLSIVFVTWLSAAAFSLSICFFLFFSFLTIVNCFFSSIFRHLKVSVTSLVDWNSLAVCTFADE